jgi:hypothetical protein
VPDAQQQQRKRANFHPSTNRDGSFHPIGASPCWVDAKKSAAIRLASRPLVNTSRIELIFRRFKERVESGVAKVAGVNYQKSVRDGLFTTWRNEECLPSLCSSVFVEPA